MDIYEKLSAIQAELKVPKNQYNSYGGFNYRSCEDILEALKPICAKHRTVLILSDAIVEMGGRYYVHATATLHDLDKESQHIPFVEATAFAREEETKKGMDGSQVTGASSSYARKYALNGLFNIDDQKDSDFTNGAQNAPQVQKAPAPKAAQPARQNARTSEPDANAECDSCGTPISEKVRDYSVKKFGVPLCMDCQREYAR